MVANKEELDALSAAEMEELIEDYLIAAATKDCSIMVTLKPYPVCGTSCNN